MQGVWDGIRFLSDNVVDEASDAVRLASDLLDKPPDVGVSLEGFECVVLAL